MTNSNLKFVVEEGMVDMRLAIEKIALERINKGSVVGREEDFIKGFIEGFIKGTTKMCKLSQFPKSVAVESIKESCDLSIEEIEKYVDKYWD